ncbi:MAG: carbonic anhydrase [Hasllibacter sp.]
MHEAQTLPPALADRFRDWKGGAFAKNAALHRRLADEGQAPETMIVACCDSRVNPSLMFGAAPGDFFVHRNIANLVPPHAPDGPSSGTPAAVEFATTALGVSRIVVMGHSLCGGVKGCHDMCAGAAPALEGTYVGRWIAALRPVYDHVKDVEDPAERLAAFERAAVVASLANLRTYPFVAERLDAGTLTLHGLWTDVGDGTLLSYDGATDAWTPV